MSLKIVVIAVISLVIMVVMIFIFSGKTRLFSAAATSCEGKGGHCAENCLADEVAHIGTDCAARLDKGESGVNGPKCCSPFDPSATPATKAPPPTTKSNE